MSVKSQYNERYLIADIAELTELLSTLKGEVKRFGARLVRHLKRRDCYKAAREWHCNWLTAYLQANSEKRSKFSS